MSPIPWQTLLKWGPDILKAGRVASGEIRKWFHKDHAESRREMDPGGDADRRRLDELGRIQEDQGRMILEIVEQVQLHARTLKVINQRLVGALLLALVAVVACLLLIVT